MDNDDAPVGRLWSRREAITLMGAAGLVAVVGCTDDAVAPTATPGAGAGGAATATSTSAPAATSSPAGAATIVPQCIVTPAQTEGPYFVDEGLNRSDIRSDPASGAVREGVVLNLAFQVGSVSGSGCAALAGAMVDVWQCDALGVYSDVQDNMTGNAGVGQKFLRGFQITDNSGLAKFVTVYPGWYQGRTVHIHFKIRTRDAAGRAQEFTSQLFFDDALSDQVFMQAPYNRKGQRTTRNSNDGIYRGGGDQLLLAPTKNGNAYDATFAVGMQRT